MGAEVERPGRELLLTSSALSFSLSLAIACWNIRIMSVLLFYTHFPVHEAERLSQKKNQVTVGDVFDRILTGPGEMGRPQFTEIYQ